MYQQRVCLLALIVVVLALSTTTVVAAFRSSEERDHEQDSTPKKQKIEHVVVLMLENRAFDHMCGWLNQWQQKDGGAHVDGLTGKEYNTVANSTKKYYVKDECPYINPFDPLHSVDGTTEEVMGVMDDPRAWVDPAPMSGFAETHLKNKDQEFWTVMHGFKPDLVPAISTLAKNFAVFDRWYSSLPGPTWPNRLFFHSGTSHGMTSNEILDYLPGMPQKTTFDVLNENNVSWGAYYQDVTDTILFKSMRELQNLERLHEYSKLKEHADEGKLPAYSWVTPQFFPWFDSPAKDQHPDHDVVDGERVIADVYEILRNSPKWNNTALVVTYDEHGGFYDHVSPPMENVPNPDGINAKDGFNYTRLGVRICTVVASPLIPKGTVISEPEEAPHRRYEHGSMYATLRNLFGLEEQLTNRTEFAATFDHVFSLDEPRTDCPLSVPVPHDPKANPTRDQEVLREQSQRKPNALQQFFYGMAEMALGKKKEDITSGKHHETQISMATSIRNMMKTLTDKL